LTVCACAAKARLSRALPIDVRKLLMHWATNALKDCVVVCDNGVVDNDDDWGLDGWLSPPRLGYLRAHRMGPKVTHVITWDANSRVSQLATRMPTPDRPCIVTPLWILYSAINMQRQPEEEFRVPSLPHTANEEDEKKKKKQKTTSECNKGPCDDSSSISFIELPPHAQTPLPSRPRKRRRSMINL